jgi:pimeloyl-ACP methyl ester carboxylesterase
MFKVVMIFIDGFGLGPDLAEINPLVAARTPGFNFMLEGKNLTEKIGEYDSKLTTIVPADASLGVEGLPQSATGQTAILTGVNAAKKLGRHISGFPTCSLRDIIKKNSIFKKISKLGLRANFINTYTRDYFKNARYHSATTLATMAGNVEFNHVEDLLAGRSIYHDLTQEILIDRGFEVPLISPRDAAVRLARELKNYEFLLFEYFKSDQMGHKQDLEKAKGVIEDLDEFLFSLVEELDLDNTLLVVVSDHGNIEDIRVKTHTFNLVPTILFGAKKDKIKDSISDLTTLTPAIIQLLKEEM